MYLYFYELPVHIVKTQGGPSMGTIDHNKLYNHNLKYYTHKYQKGRVMYNDSDKFCGFKSKHSFAALCCELFLGNKKFTIKIKQQLGKQTGPLFLHFHHYKTVFHHF